MDQKLIKKWEMKRNKNRLIDYLSSFVTRMSLV